MKLLPADPLGRARVRELMEVIDLYLELAARRLYPEALFDGTVTSETKGAVREDLRRGVAGLERIARFAPYLAGSEVSLADFSAAIHFPMVSIASQAIYGEDVLDAIPGVGEHRQLMYRRESLQRIRADRKVRATCPDSCSTASIKQPRQRAEGALAPAAKASATVAKCQSDRQQGDDLARSAAGSILASALPGPEGIYLYGTSRVIPILRVRRRRAPS